MNKRDPSRQKSPSHSFKAAPLSSFKVFTDPDGFFASIRGHPSGGAWGWLCGGLVLALLGGPLSFLLSASLGVPLDRILTMMSASSTPLGSYVIFLVEVFVVLLAAFVLVSACWWFLALLLGAEASFHDTFWISSHACAPLYIAMAVPQVSVVDTVAWSPMVQMVVSNYNFMVDFLQLAAFAWFIALVYIAARSVWGLPRFRAVLFAVPPAVLGIIVVLLGLSAAAA